MTTFRECLVPRCKNNSKNQPGKIFISVPRNLKRRKMWAHVLQRQHIPDKSRYACCEDHFNLPEDSTNWMYFKMLGPVLQLKPNVIPHRYINVSPPRQLTISQMCDASKKRKAENVSSWLSAPDPQKGCSSMKFVKRRLFIDIRNESPKEELASPLETEVPRIKSIESRSRTFPVSKSVISVGTQSNVKTATSSQLAIPSKNFDKNKLKQVRQQIKTDRLKRRAEVATNEFCFVDVGALNNTENNEDDDEEAICFVEAPPALNHVDVQKFVNIGVETLNMGLDIKCQSEDSTPVNEYLVVVLQL